MRLVQFCSIKRSSVCGLKFGGGVVFSQICSVASGAFKEQYTLLVSLNLSVNERKPSTSSNWFFCLFLILNICWYPQFVWLHVLNSNNAAKPEKNIETHRKAGLIKSWQVVVLGWKAFQAYFCILYAILLGCHIDANRQCYVRWCWTFNQLSLTSFSQCFQSLTTDSKCSAIYPLLVSMSHPNCYTLDLSNFVEVPIL